MKAVGFNQGLRYTKLQNKAGLNIPNRSECIQYLPPQIPVYNPITGYWEYKDAIGKIDKEPEKGYCFNFNAGTDEADFGIGMANETITYFDGTTEQTVTLNASGVLTGFSGKFGQVYQKDGSGKYTHIWHCDENGGEVGYDCVGTAHMTLSGITPSTFFAEDIRFRSYQNEFGGSIQDATHILPDYEAGINYPLKINEDGVVQNEDVFGNTPTYFGRTKNNVKIVGNRVGRYDGIDDETTFTGSDIANITSINFRIKPDTLDWQEVITYTGLYQIVGTTLTVGYDGTNRFKGDIGWIEFITPNKTYRYDFGEGAGDIVYDRVETVYGDDKSAGMFQNSTNPSFDYDSITSVCLDIKSAIKTPSGTAIAVSDNPMSINAGSKYLISYSAPTGVYPGLSCYFQTSDGGTGSNLCDDFLDLTSGASGILNCITSSTIARLTIFTTGTANYAIEITGIQEIFEPVDGTITGAITDPTDPNTFWATDYMAEPSNIPNGFDTWENDSHLGDEDYYLRVPFDTNGNSIKTSSDAIAGYAWVSRNPAGKWHNGAESVLEEYEVPELYEADANLTDHVLFNHITFEPLPITYSDREANYGLEGYIFSNIETMKWREFAVYSSEQTDNNLYKILNKMKAIEDLLEVNLENISSSDVGDAYVYKEGYK